jgi:hypothetical protein
VTAGETAQFLMTEILLIEGQGTLALACSGLVIWKGKDNPQCAYAQLGGAVE